VSGHPFLVPAALENVRLWKYQPFEIDGKPAVVTSVVMVTFGKPANHSAEDRAELAFQDDFWTSQEAAQSAIEKKNFSGAEQDLAKAGALLNASTGPKVHVREQWIWAMTMGEVLVAQEKFADAEKYYGKALALHQNDGKDSPELAATLAKFASLYGDEKKYAEAQTNGARSLAIYQNLFKHSANPQAHQIYGQIIASEARMLSKVASQSDHTAVLNNCRTVLEFQNYLSAADRDDLVTSCQQAPTPQAAK
jgi:tetratricopeptide (TPR) repeat protein